LFAVESPKSNATAVAIGNVMSAIERNGNAEVPLHLRDTHYKGATSLGHGGYQYPHDFPNHYVKQQYLPDTFRNMTFYKATAQGMEDKIKQNQERRLR
jgi:putative ATPase